MKKALKILGFILLGLVLLGSIFLYYGSRKLKRAKIAEENANYIINNLNKEAILNEFPERYFPNRAQLKDVVGGLGQNCDWDKRDGKFVDFCTMKEIGGINSTAFIYEYYLKCDSLRFILIYNTDSEKPELYKFNIEPIEVPNSMILFPEKQLKNRR